MWKPVAKALLSAGLKKAVPVLGEVAVAVLDTGGKAVLDAVIVQDEVRNRLDRLLERVTSSLNALERVPPDEEARVGELIQEVMASHGLQFHEWVDVQLDAELATRRVLERSAQILEGHDLTTVERTRTAIALFHRAVLQDRELIHTLEPAFREVLLGQLTEFKVKLATLPANMIASAERAAAEALLAIPSVPWREGISPPGALLRADCEAGVPFHGRTVELDDLQKWCADPARLKVRLYTGVGGMGKTRLMREFCARYQAEGGRAGFLDRRVAGVSGSILRAMVQGARTLVVIDYAETRRDETEALLQALWDTDRAGRSARVVLLARDRTNAGWWDRLKESRGAAEQILNGPSTTEHYLAPLASGVVEREKTYRLAVEAFAARLRRTASVATPDLSGPDLDPVLLIHIQALAAIEGVPVKGERGLLDYVLLRERRFWSEFAAAQGIEPLLVPAVARLMALITLNKGVATADEAFSIARLLPDLQGQPAPVIAICKLLHHLYPGEGWIDPLEPDLLGEHLVETETTRDESLLDLAFVPFAKA